MGCAALPRARPCPDHPPRPVDYRDGLGAISPDPSERAAYDAEAEAAANTPPCSRCGWWPPAPVGVQAVNWDGGYRHADQEDREG